MGKKEELFSVIQYTDSETGIEDIGELDYLLYIDRLEEFFKYYKHDGLVRMLAHLGFIAIQMKRIYDDVFEDENNSSIGKGE